MTASTIPTTTVRIGAPGSAEHLAGRVALVEEQDGLAGPGADGIDRDQVAARRLPDGSSRSQSRSVRPSKAGALIVETTVPTTRRELHGSPSRGAIGAGAESGATASTIPTIAWSTGTNGSGIAWAASRAATK